MTTSIKDFIQSYQGVAERLFRTGEPEEIELEDGRRFVIQDAQSFHEANDLSCDGDYEACLPAIESMNRGEGRPFSEFKKEMAEKYGLPET